jgi:alkylation response protein AidB-like acyl-CoA dehydrogenase
MIDVYGLDGDAGHWRQAAATLAAEILTSHAAEVDAQARFPKEGMAALAHGGFDGLCLDVQFGGHGQGPVTFAVERFFRDARAGWVMAPTVDRLADFLGRALNGLPLQ